MVKKNSNKNRRKKQVKNTRKNARKTKKQRAKKQRLLSISPNTPYGVCREKLSSFGGLLALVKFLDLIKFQDIFEDKYAKPKRKTKLGNYRMVLGLLIMLFIGFVRIGHIEHLRNDPMVTGVLKVPRLPAVSTFWRYLISLGIFQSQALLRITAAIRIRVWKLVGYQPKKIRVDIDTTVSTIYGDIQGARKGHNTKHRGKKGLRPVWCFINETREYLTGKQRRGETITGQEVAKLIRGFRKLLPACVKQVLVSGDGEFISWTSVSACLEEDFMFIFGNKRCTPPFPEDRWYSRGKFDYNECEYQPAGWEKPCRFVVMRIPKDQKQDRQLKLFEEDNYMYRVFVTNLQKKPHNVIADYDKRADVENSIGEAQREGILAIPSKRFQSNHAFFQIVMLAYNLWRWMKLAAGRQLRQSQNKSAVRQEVTDKVEVETQTIRLTRLKLLYISAKLTFHNNRDQVYYSIHDNRASTLIDFLDYLDKRRAEKIAWPTPGDGTMYAATG